MSPSLNPFICLFVILGFIGLILITKKDKNKSYLQYVLVAFPLIQCTITIHQISCSAFDIITYLFLLSLYRRKHVKLYHGRTYTLLLLIIILVSVIGCYSAPNLEVDYTGKAFVTFGSVFIFVKILIDECLDDPSFFYDILKCMKISLITSLIFLVGQLIFGVGFTISIVRNPNITSEGVRYFSYFNDPQLYSQFLAAQSFLLLIKDRKTDKVSFPNYLLFFLTVIGILLTGGRAGFGGWAAGLLIILLFGNSVYRFAALVGGTVLFFVIYAFANSFVIFQRSSLTDTYDFRYDIWLEALQIFKSHPIFGIGLGNYHNYVSVHYPDQVWMIEGQPEYFNHPESGYLKFLTELGISGFSSIILLLLIPIIKAFNWFAKYRDTSVIFLIAALISWMVGFYTVYSLLDVRMEVFIATVIGLLITSYKRFIPDNVE